MSFVKSKRGKHRPAIGFPAAFTNKNVKKARVVTRQNKK